MAQNDVIELSSDVKVARGEGGKYFLTYYGVNKRIGAKSVMNNLEHLDARFHAKTDEEVIARAQKLFPYFRDGREYYLATACPMQVLLVVKACEQWGAEEARVFLAAIGLDESGVREKTIDSISFAECYGSDGDRYRLCIVVSKNAKDEKKLYVLHKPDTDYVDFRDGGRRFLSPAAAKKLSEAIREFCEQIGRAYAEDSDFGVVYSDWGEKGDGIMLLKVGEKGACEHFIIGERSHRGEGHILDLIVHEKQEIAAKKYADNGIAYPVERWWSDHATEPAPLSVVSDTRLACGRDFPQGTLTVLEAKLLAFLCASGKKYEYLDVLSYLGLATKADTDYLESVDGLRRYPAEYSRLTADMAEEITTFSKHGFGSMFSPPQEIVRGKIRIRGTEYEFRWVIIRESEFYHTKRRFSRLFAVSRYGVLDEESRIECDEALAAKLDEISLNCPFDVAVVK